MQSSLHRQYILSLSNAQVPHTHELPRPQFFYKARLLHNLPMPRINASYDCIILDFGDEYLSFREEFLHCDKKVILLSLNPWQKFTAVKLLEAMRRKSWGNIQPMYASVHTQKNIKQEIEKLYGIEIFEIPEILNPVCITPDKFACLEQILGRSHHKYSPAYKRFLH